MTPACSLPFLTHCRLLHLLPGPQATCVGTARASRLKTGEKVRDGHPQLPACGVTVASAYSPASLKVTLSSRKVTAIRASYTLLPPETLRPPQPVFLSPAGTPTITTTSRLNKQSWAEVRTDHVSPQPLPPPAKCEATLRRPVPLPPAVGSSPLARLLGSESSGSSQSLVPRAPFLYDFTHGSHRTMLKVPPQRRASGRRASHGQPSGSPVQARTLLAHVSQGRRGQPQRHGVLLAPWTMLPSSSDEATSWG